VVDNAGIAVQRHQRQNDSALHSYKASMMAGPWSNKNDKKHASPIVNKRNLGGVSGATVWDVHV
jgi:hypothetical protein